ncbi:MAG: PQQ-binding-like beta-propeller repeat protein, partial [Planctomycetota bacterium]|nr:PQQ-binding-like beta-propeller repeat protein [Planctomycetota bacterium]
MKKRSLPMTAMACACLFILFFTGADWTQFRGEQAGVADKSDAVGLPLRWSADKNVVWKTPLPGPGASSPIVVRKLVYLTAYSGYGLSKAEPGEQADLRHHLLCL